LVGQEKKGKNFRLNKLCSSVKVNLTLQHFDSVNPNHGPRNPKTVGHLWEAAIPIFRMNLIILQFFHKKKRNM